MTIKNDQDFIKHVAKLRQQNLALKLLVEQAQEVKKRKLNFDQFPNFKKLLRA